jgi:TatD DNase family protein
LTYLDAHIHLADPAYGNNIDSIIEDASKKQVTLLLSNAVDYNSSVQTIALADKHDERVLATVGVHPSTVVNEVRYGLSQFEKMIDANRRSVRAIGEIGLDGKYTKDQEKICRQREVFRFFLNLAEKKRLPAVVHSRLAVDEVLDELAGFNLPRVLLHWYDGPIDKIRVIEDRGYLISLGPALHYSKRLADIAKSIDLSTVLSETDGPVPYHGPFEGKETVPSFVIDVVTKLAEIKHSTVQQVSEAIWLNFQRFIQTPCVT